VGWSGGQFYLILSNNGFSDTTGDQYSTTINLSNLTDTTAVSTYQSGPFMTWLVGNNWVNGSIPFNVAGGNYFIKAFDGAATSVAVTDTYITVTAAFMVFPSSGTAGQALMMMGWAFSANAKVNITYLNTTGTNYIPIANQVQADALGAFVYNTAAIDLKQLTTPAGSSTPTMTPIIFNAKDVPGDGYNSTYIEYSRGLWKVIGSTTSQNRTAPAGTLWGNATDFTGSILVERQVNQTIRLVGMYFAPGTANILWDGVTNIGTATVNGTGYFDATINVPMTGVGGHWIVIQDSGVSFYVRVYVTPTLILNPSSGPIGTTVTVTAYGFPASVGTTTVYNATLRWYGDTDKNIAWALTDSTGMFTTTFVVPKDFGGSHAVTATVNGSTTTSTAYFTITPMLSVSPSTFANNCTIYVTASGTGFDPEEWYFFYVDNALYIPWTAAEEDGDLVVELASGGFRPGMHKVHVIMDDEASPYKIVANATFWVTLENDYEGALLTSINNTVTSLSGLSGVNATLLLGINNGVASLQTDMGVVKADIAAIKPVITTISSGVATVQTSIGTLQTSLSSISGTLSSVSGTMGTISTSIGHIDSSLASIGTKVTSIENGVATIQTDLGTLQGTVTATDGKVATIQTGIGTLTADVADVQTSVDAVPGAVNLPIWIAVILALVAAIASIACLFLIRKKIAG